MVNRSIPFSVHKKVLSFCWSGDGSGNAPIDWFLPIQLLQNNSHENGNTHGDTWPPNPGDPQSDPNVTYIVIEM